MPGSPEPRPDLALGAQEKPRWGKSLRTKRFPPLERQGAILQFRTGRLLMSRRGRTTVRAVEVPRRVPSTRPAPSFRAGPDDEPDECVTSRIGFR
jgi:hypothetical protein